MFNTKKGLSVGTSCFDQNIKCLLCVDVFVDENVSVRSGRQQMDI